ncbi:hypothetical protein AALA54_02510 [Oscillospiraceae bacterium 44-34]
MYLHTHYFMDLRRPASRLEIITIVLSALAVFFTLMFGLGYIIAIPMRSGEPWMLGVIGLLLLFAAIPCTLIAQLQGRRREWLRCGGFPVQGRVVKVRRHLSVNYGSQRHPWTVLCEYHYEGQTCTARSTFLWDEPVGSTAKIFLDQDRPGQAWVDPKSLQYKINLR